MASSNRGAEDGVRAYSSRAGRERRRQQEVQQVKAAKAAGRGKRSV